MILYYSFKCDSTLCCDIIVLFIRILHIYSNMNCINMMVKTIVLHSIIWHKRIYGMYCITVLYTAEPNVVICPTPNIWIICWLLINIALQCSIIWAIVLHWLLCTISLYSFLALLQSYASYYALYIVL